MWAISLKRNKRIDSIIPSIQRIREILPIVLRRLDLKKYSVANISPLREEGILAVTYRFL